MKRLRVSQPVRYKEVTSEVRNEKGYIIGFAKGVYAEDEDIEFATMNLMIPPPFETVIIRVGRMSGQDSKSFVIDLSSHSYTHLGPHTLYLVKGKPFKRKPKLSYS